MKRTTLYGIFALISLFTAPVAMAQVTNIVVTESDLQNWLIAPDGPANEVPYEFIEGSSTNGVGSLEFGPIGATPAAKFVMYPPIANLPVQDFSFFSFDFEVLSGSNQDFYYNIYVDSISNGIGTFTNGFYDCRYDLVSTAGGINQWATTVGSGTNGNWTNTENGTGDCAGDIVDITVDSLILFIAINGGQSTASDIGLAGRFDTVVLRTTDGQQVVWDFEPEATIQPGGGSVITAIPAGTPVGMALMVLLLLGTALVRLRS